MGKYTKDAVCQTLGRIRGVSLLPANSEAGRPKPTISIHPQAKLGIGTLGKVDFLVKKCGFVVSQRETDN